MVVTRRPITAPMPPTSRTNSSQQTSRLPKATTSQDTPGPSSPLANGDQLGATAASTSVGSSHVPKGPQFSDDVVFADPGLPSPKKHSGKSKNKGKSKREAKEPRHAKSASHGFVDLLARIFLLWFTIYTLSVCPVDVTHESRICRGLAEYRRLVLEPYILPPIQAALAHPSVKPYVDTVKPHIDRAISVTTPVLIRGRDEWNKHVVPQWNQHVAPQLKRADRLYIAPYRERAYDEYERRLAPHVRIVSHNLERWQRHAQPYILLAAVKTYNGYQTAKPYALPVWKQAKANVGHLITVLGQARRQYIDPHVAKILDKVEELGGGGATKFTGKKASPEDSQNKITPAPESTKQSIKSAKVSTASSTSLPPVPEPTAKDTLSAASAISNPISADEPILTELLSSGSGVVSSVTETLSSASSVASASAKETLSSASSAISSVAVRASSSASSTLSKAAEILFSSDSFVASDSLSSVASSEAVTSSTASSLAPSSSATEEDDIDLQAFYAELGMIEEEVPEPTAEPPKDPPAETEEEKAERLRQEAIKTAEKRKKIEAKHSEWEDTLEKIIKEKKKELRKSLVVIRKSAASEIRSSSENRAQIDKLVEDSNKILKGAESYLKNLLKEARPEEEKLSMWNKVTEKVDNRFTERLQETETFLHNQYMQAVEKEIAEVERVAAVVKDVAGEGQASVGMDYAWLEDVTYLDWQRYHDLMRTSNKFRDLAYSIQNGSHPSPPVNPLLDAVEDLRTELEEIIAGFESRFLTVQRNGARAIEDSFKPVLVDVPEPDVSILPVPSPEVSQEKTHDVPEPIFIGRSVEEVRQALDAVGQVAPQQVAKIPIVVEEPAAETGEATSPAHVEL